MSEWTDEWVEIVKKLWGEGMSASQIAGRLGGVTRNAVIGKVHRLGLSGRAVTSPRRSYTPRIPRNTGPRKPRTPSLFNGNGHGKPKPQFGEPEYVVLPAAAPHPDSLNPQGFRMGDLEDNQCSFIIDAKDDDGNELLNRCCGMPKANGSFCDFHYERTHQLGSSRNHTPKIALPERDFRLADFHHGKRSSHTFDGFDPDSLSIPAPEQPIALLPPPAGYGHTNGSTNGVAATNGTTHHGPTSTSNGQALALREDVMPQDEDLCLANVVGAVEQYYGAVTSSHAMTALFAVADGNVAVLDELEDLLGADTLDQMYEALEHGRHPKLPLQIVETLKRLAHDAYAEINAAALQTAADGFIRHNTCAPLQIAKPQQQALPRPTEEAKKWQASDSSTTLNNTAPATIRSVAAGKLLLKDIVTLTALCGHTTYADVISQRRHRDVVQVRQAAAYLCRELTAKSLHEIGRHIGDRDHTTVLNSLKRVEEKLGNEDILTKSLVAQVVRTFEAQGMDLSEVVSLELRALVDGMQFEPLPIQSKRSVEVIPEPVEDEELPPPPPRTITPRVYLEAPVKPNGFAYTALNGHGINGARHPDPEPEHDEPEPIAQPTFKEEKPMPNDTTKLTENGYDGREEQLKVTFESLGGEEPVDVNIVAEKAFDEHLDEMVEALVAGKYDSVEAVLEGMFIPLLRKAQVARAHELERQNKTQRRAEKLQAETTAIHYRVYKRAIRALIAGFNEQMRGKFDPQAPMHAQVALLAQDGRSPDEIAQTILDKLFRSELTEDKITVVPEPRDDR